MTVEFKIFHTHKSKDTILLTDRDVVNDLQDIPQNENPFVAVVVLHTSTAGVSTKCLCYSISVILHINATRTQVFQLFEMS
jgi:hypothetical protein